MLYEEFVKLTRFNVDERYYHDEIEPEYMRSDLDKVAFCESWIKSGGITTAYYIAQSQVYALEAEKRMLEEQIKMYIGLINSMA